MNILEDIFKNIQLYIDECINHTYKILTQSYSFKSEYLDKNQLNIFLEQEIFKVTDEADVVYPYDGRLYQTPHLLKETLFREDGIKHLENNLTLLRLMYGTDSYGGCFMINKNKYVESGMENENFYGWAPEDLERVKRWEILNYKIRRACGMGFHLSHSTLYQNKSRKEELSLSNNRELFRICAMRTDELQRDIRMWEWCKKK